jgi:hypothetical protein
MTLYSYQGEYPKPLPFRIHLSDGRTRTDSSTFTPEEIADAGYVAVDNPPTIESNQVLEWHGDDFLWVVRDKTLQELLAEEEAQWNIVRAERDRLLAETDYVVLVAYEQGIPVEEEYVTYRQELRDIPQTQEDPFNIFWPTLYFNES